MGRDLDFFLDHVLGNEDLFPGNADHALVGMKDMMGSQGMMDKMGTKDMTGTMDKKELEVESGMNSISPHKLNCNADHVIDSQIEFSDSRT